MFNVTTIFWVRFGCAERKKVATTLLEVAHKERIHKKASSGENISAIWKPFLGVAGVGANTKNHFPFFC